MHSHEKTILNTIIQREHIALNRGNNMKYIIVDNYGNEYGEVFDNAADAQQECDYFNSDGEDCILSYEIMPV